MSTPNLSVIRYIRSLITSLFKFQTGNYVHIRMNMHIVT